MKRRAIDQKVADGVQASADDANKLILASGISAESAKLTGLGYFGFAGASTVARPLEQARLGQCFSASIHP